MTKKQRQTIKGVRAILDITEKSQPQLAKDIGASVSTVKSWTRRPKKDWRTINPDFRRRIFAAYGAMINDGGRLFSVVNGREQPYTKKSFDGWSNYLINAKRPHKLSKPENQEQSIVNYFSSRGTDSLCRIFHAASEYIEHNRGKKLFAVVESFNQWAENTIADFKLSKSNQFHPRYRPIMKSVTPENNLPPDFAANSVIKEGSPRFNAHIEHLQAAAKKGDKTAIANLKQRGIEPDKTAEKLRC
ncbi:MAG TPA: hypothetical protein VMV89_03660 [Candidatus Paceibacterota bacterium]|nr:hypothetical protein [Candidatus Paceibacterota bacterium]